MVPGTRSVADLAHRRDNREAHVSVRSPFFNCVDVCCGDDLSGGVPIETTEATLTSGPFDLFVKLLVLYYASPGFNRVGMLTLGILPGVLQNTPYIWVLDSYR
jgi:hypothetical protein